VDPFKIANCGLKNSKRQPHMTKTNFVIPVEKIERSIFLIRGQRVMLDRDLAYLYGVPTKVLNQAVKRNERRFPSDFMFRLTKEEKKGLVTNCDRLARLKHSSALPSVFTEQGVAMLSSVLNTERAIEVNILIMRAFVRLREAMASGKEFARRLEELERRIASHDENIRTLFQAIRQLMAPPAPGRNKIGFQLKEKRSPYLAKSRNRKISNSALWIRDS
jgi:ORF6N domain